MKHELADFRITTPIGDVWRGIVAMTRSAFLKYVQADNKCTATGRPCRTPGQCGCWLEMENAINAER